MDIVGPLTRNQYPFLASMLAFHGIKATLVNILQHGRIGDTKTQEAKQNRVSVYLHTWQGPTVSREILQRYYEANLDKMLSHMSMYSPLNSLWQSRQRLNRRSSG